MRSNMHSRDNFRTGIKPIPINSIKTERIKFPGWETLRGLWKIKEGQRSENTGKCQKDIFSLGTSSSIASSITEIAQILELSRPRCIYGRTWLFLEDSDQT